MNDSQVERNHIQVLDRFNHCKRLKLDSWDFFFFWLDLFCFVHLIVFEFVLFFFVPFTYIEMSEIQASEEHKESYPTSQCAAVTTQYLLIRVPPQMCRRSVVCMDTMYLIEWGTGAYPPTMRSFTRSSPVTSTQRVGDKKKRKTLGFSRIEDRET